MSESLGCFVCNDEHGSFPESIKVMITIRGIDTSLQIIVLRQGNFPFFVKSYYLSSIANKLYY